MSAKRDGTTRRTFLAQMATIAALPAHAQGGWYDLTSDDGRPVQNMRLPVELVMEIARLPGLIRRRSGTAAVTLVEFTDFNCPFCKRAAADLPALVAANKDLHLAHVNNPILSAGSREAALIEIAVLKHMGPGTALSFHARMFASPGKADRAKALAVLKAMSLPAEAIDDIAAPDEEVTRALELQMKLAASLALGVTPSFVAGPTAILGYPGPKTIQRVVSALNRCEKIVCA